MPTEVIMPMLGMAQETGKLLRWLKAEGEKVTKGQPLIEVETDKVTVEIEAPANGTLSGISAAEGDDVPVGRAIAYILVAGESLPDELASSEPVGSGTIPVAAAVVPVAAEAGGGNGSTPGATVQSRKTLASPKARRLAQTRGISIEEIVGTGPYGAVIAADVEAWTGAGRERTATPGPLPSVVPAAGSELAVSSAWRTMAERMHRSWQGVPHFYLQRDVDATRLNSWRDAVRSRPGYEKVTHTDLLVKICAAALAQHPRVNSSWSGGALIAPAGINVGIAVATEDALIVPVVHDADRLGLREVAERRADLVARAREKKLRPDDVSGGTFTISNLGMFGVDAFSAIVNTPQAAILAVGRISDRVVVVDGAAVVRPTLTLTLSFDHRAVDGATGARFLETLASLVEEPAGLVA